MGRLPDIKNTLQVSLKVKINAGLNAKRKSRVDGQEVAPSGDNSRLHSKNNSVDLGKKPIKDLIVGETVLELPNVEKKPKQHQSAHAIIGLGSRVMEQTLSHEIRRLQELKEH
jgi:hypothetical protein